MSLLCDDNSVLLLRQYVKKLTEFLSLYNWIIDAYVSVSSILTGVCKVVSEFCFQVYIHIYSAL